MRFSCLSLQRPRSVLDTPLPMLSHPLHALSVLQWCTARRCVRGSAGLVVKVATETGVFARSCGACVQRSPRCIAYRHRLARTCRVGFVVVDFVVESLLLAVSLVPLAVMNGGLTNGTAVTSSAAPVADCVVFGDGLHPDSVRETRHDSTCGGRSPLCAVQDCRGPTLLVAIVVGCVVMAGLLAWVIESQCMTASQVRACGWLTTWRTLSWYSTRHFLCAGTHKAHSGAKEVS